MNGLCVKTLNEIVAGELRLGDMPPLGGEWEPVGRLQVEASQIHCGDVLCSGPDIDPATAGRPQWAEEAFARDGLGVISSGPPVQPWAGKFSIRVPNASAALCELAAWARNQFTGHLITLVDGPQTRPLAGALMQLLRWRWHGEVMPRHSALAVDVLLQLVDLDADADFGIVTTRAVNTVAAEYASQICRPDLLIWTSGMSAKEREMTSAERELMGAMPASGSLIVWEPASDGNDYPTDATVVRVGTAARCDVRVWPASHGNPWTFELGDERLQTPGSSASPLAHILAAAAARRLDVPVTAIAAQFQVISGWRTRRSAA